MKAAALRMMTVKAVVLNVKAAALRMMNNIFLIGPPFRDGNQPRHMYSKSATIPK